MAADSLVGESMNEPSRYFINNVAGTLALLQSMVQAKVLKFVFSSSAAVYAPGEELPMPEAHPLGPQSVYGETKLAVERALPWYQRAHGLSWASLRYFNAAGASELHGEWHEPETHLIPLALDAAAGRQPALPLFGEDYPTPDGTCIRDYVHVLDLAEAHALAAEAAERDPGGRVLNLGSGQGFSNRQVISTVEKVSGCPVPLRKAPRREGDQPATVASNQAARTQLGWAPRHGLEDMVRSAWVWRQSHPQGYMNPTISAS
jgi:UDP-glucose 4-epimerase